MATDDPREEERLFALFASLRDHVVELVTDLSERVQQALVAEDDGRFGAPSLKDILTDLTRNASGVITDLAGSDGVPEDDPDGTDE